MQRNYGVLSDIEFEALVAELLGEEREVKYERFAPGKDGGVDARYLGDNADQPDVIQCKHYWRSPFDSLLRSLRGEVGKVESLAPRRYTVATTRELSPDQKDAIAQLFDPYMPDASYVLGPYDIDDRLDRQPQIERHHYKLWLASAEILGTILHGDVFVRSQGLVDSINRDLPRFVQTRSFADAHAILQKERVCVVSGIPGIGKTTLARMLLLDAIARDYEPIDVSADIDEAARTWRSGAKQIFYYDDFLGRTTMDRLLGKNEDRRLAEFVDRVAHDPTKLLIMTTREYILTEARSSYEHIARAVVETRRFLLKLGHYSRRNKARVLYNHIYHSTLSPDYKRAFLRERGYFQIIDHRNFNPRLIETLINQLTTVAPAPDQVVASARTALERPMVLWETAFDRELNETHRRILLALASFSNGAPLENLATACESLARARGASLGIGEYERALKTLETTFIEIEKSAGGLVVGFANASVEDFLASYLASHAEEFRSLVSGVIYFDQIQHLWQMSRLRSTDERKAGRPDFALARQTALMDFAPAAETVFNSDAIRTESYGPRQATEPSEHEIDGRITSLLRMAAEGAGGVDRVKPKFEGRLSGLETREDSHSLIDMVVAASSVPELEEVAKQRATPALKAKLLRDPQYAGEWEQVRYFLTVLPDSVTAKEFDDMSRQFESFVANEFEESSLPESLDELEDLAAFFNVSLDTRLRIEEAVERERQGHEPEEDESWADEAASARETDEEIEALFARLEDSSA